MKKQSAKYFTPLILFCLTACNFQGNRNEEPGPALFPQPKSFPVNTDGGYITNTLTGDTIQPLINSLGDTIKTGVAIPTQGKFINPDSVSKPKIVKAGANPKTVNAHPNVHIIPENLTIIPVDESKLKKIYFTPPTSPFPSGRDGDGTAERKERNLCIKN